MITRVILARIISCTEVWNTSCPAPSPFPSSSIKFLALCNTQHYTDLCSQLWPEYRDSLITFLVCPWTLKFVWRETITDPQGLWCFLPGVFPRQMGKSAEVQRVYSWVSLSVEEATVKWACGESITQTENFVYIC